MDLLENLKSNYVAAEAEQFSNEDLIAMLSVNKHPSLKGIRNQLIIESIFWIGFLAFYYDMFDGHLKPTLWNVLLVLAVGFLLVHNLLGYRITNNPINGSNITRSLMNYLNRIRKYAYLSISARVFALLILFGYFFSGLESIESRHYWSIGAIGLIVAIQVYFLWRVWSKRIASITSSYAELVVEK